MTKPTPAQIEADSFIQIIKKAELITLHIGDKKVGLGRDMQDRIIAGLTAAAEVAEPLPRPFQYAVESAVAATIERCAQVADHRGLEGQSIAAAIRKLKEQP